MPIDYKLVQTEFLDYAVSYNPDKALKCVCVKH